MDVSEKNPETIRSIFGDACARRDLLILSTKYFTLESYFVHLDGDEVHVKTISDGEQALITLGSYDASLRFPYKLDFMGAKTKLIGLGDYEGKKTIKFALPLSIYTSDGRKTSRITQLDGTYVTLNLRGRFIHADMVDLSVTGAMLAMAVDLPNGELRVKDRVMLSIHLSNDISINSGAIVRHVKNSTFGVEFSPDLSDSDMISISSWFFRRMEKEREHLANRMVTSADAVAATEGMVENADKGGILLVTLDDGMESTLSKLLGAAGVFYRVLPDTTLLKNALSKKPRLVIFHMSDNSAIERQLLKSLSEMISPGLLTMLLGTDVDNDLLVETGLSCKAKFAVLWTPGKGLFLQRLVLGIMRKRYK